MSHFTMLSEPFASAEKWQAENRLFYNEIEKNSRYFVGVFNKTIFPLALVGYGMIIANSERTISSHVYKHLQASESCRTSCNLDCFKI